MTEERVNVDREVFWARELLKHRSSYVEIPSRYLRNLLDALDAERELRQQADRELSEAREMLALCAADTTAPDLAQEIEFLKAEHAHTVTTLEERAEKLAEALKERARDAGTAAAGFVGNKDFANARYYLGKADAFREAAALAEYRAAKTSGDTA